MRKAITETGVIGYQENRSLLDLMAEYASIPWNKPQLLHSLDQTRCLSFEKCLKNTSQKLQDVVAVFVCLDVGGMVMALQQRTQQFSVLIVAVVTKRHHYSVKVKVVSHNQEVHQNYQRHIGGSTK